MSNCSPSQPSINVKEHEQDEATGPTGGDTNVTTYPAGPVYDNKVREAGVSRLEQLRVMEK